MSHVLKWWFCILELFVEFLVILLSQFWFIHKPNGLFDIHFLIIQINVMSNKVLILLNYTFKSCFIQIVRVLWFQVDYYSSSSFKCGLIFRDFSYIKSTWSIRNPADQRVWGLLSRKHLNCLAYYKRWVKPNSELANYLISFLSSLLNLLDKLFATWSSNRAQVINQILVSHTHSCILNNDLVLVFVNIDIYLKW